MPDAAVIGPRTRVRLAPPPTLDGLDPIVLSVSVRLVGREMTLGEVGVILDRTFPGRSFYAAGPCRCGLPHCSNLDHGVVGYIDPCVCDNPFCRGTHRAILRFDAIGEGGRHVQA